MQSTKIISPYETKAFPESWRVPQGTNERIFTYLGILEKWNKKINLVASQKINSSDFWTRHVLDSLQLLEEIKPHDHVLDVGSGAGFPALILAAAGISKLTLVESDLRKCEFLKEAARQMGLNLSILNQRIEQVQIPEPADVISARAFAELDALLDVTEHLNAGYTRYVLLKGKQAGTELDKARQKWEFTSTTRASITDKDAHIITITNLGRRGQ